MSELVCLWGGGCYRDGVRDLPVKLGAGLAGLRHEQQVIGIDEDRPAVTLFAARRVEGGQRLRCAAGGMQALGEHILTHFLEAKRGEWAEYISRVQPWETAKYLEAY